MAEVQEYLLIPIAQSGMCMWLPPNLTCVSMCLTWFPNMQAVVPWRLLGTVPGSQVCARAYYTHWCKHTDDTGMNFSAGSISSKHYLPIKSGSCLLFVAMVTCQTLKISITYVLWGLLGNGSVFTRNRPTLKCYSALYTLSSRKLAACCSFYF